MSMHDHDPKIHATVYKKVGVEPGEQLPEFAWPGGYPLYYYDADNLTLCPACANRTEEYSACLVEADVNWEDANLWCENCHLRIESAYAD